MIAKQNHPYLRNDCEGAGGVNDCKTRNHFDPSEMIAGGFQSFQQGGSKEMIAGGFQGSKQREERK